MTEGHLLIARLLDGAPADSVDLAGLTHPWNALAEAILSANGTGRLTAFRTFLAELPGPQAAKITTTIFPIDPFAQGPFAEMVETPSRKRFTASEIMAMDIPPLRWTVEGMLVRPGLCSIAGQPKIGKSFMALQLAHSVSTGRPFLGREVVSGPVLYVALEDGLSRLQSRLQMAGWEPNNNHVHFLFELPPLDKGGLGYLSEQIEELNPVLVIVDSLAAAKSGGVDENEASDIAELAYPLSNLSRDADLTMTVVHHHKKSATGDPGRDLRGSSAFFAALDGLLSLYRERNAPEAKLSIDGRDCDVDDLSLEWTGSGWAYIGGVEVMEERKKERKVIEALQKMPDGGTTAEVAYAAGVRKEDTTNILKDLEQRQKKAEISKPEGTGRPRIVYKWIG